MRLFHAFLTLWVRSDQSVVSNQPQVGRSRIDMRSVREFSSFHVYPLSHWEDYKQTLAKKHLIHFSCFWLERFCFKPEPPFFTAYFETLKLDFLVILRNMI